MSEPTGLALASIADTAPLVPFIKLSTNNPSDDSKSSAETPSFLNSILGCPRSLGGGPDVYCRATATPHPPKDLPTPSTPTVHGPYSAKTLQLIRDNHGAGFNIF